MRHGSRSSVSKALATMNARDTHGRAVAPLPRVRSANMRKMTLRSAFTFAAGITLAAVAGIMGFGQPQPELKVGDEAPAFNLPGSDGKAYRLADYEGKSAVVLAWFPKAFTGG